MKEKGVDGPGAAKYGPVLNIGKTFMGSLSPGRKFGSSFDQNHKNAANIGPGPAGYDVLKSAANISLKKPVYSIGRSFDSVHFDQANIGPGPVNGYNYSSFKKRLTASDV
jgi:hypothetical protein